MRIVVNIVKTREEYLRKDIVPETLPLYARIGNEFRSRVICRKGHFRHIVRSFAQTEIRHIHARIRRAQNGREHSHVFSAARQKTVVPDIRRQREFAFEITRYERIALYGAGLIHPHADGIPARRIAGNVNGNFRFIVFRKGKNHVDQILRRRIIIVKLVIFRHIGKTFRLDDGFSRVSADGKVRLQVLFFGTSCGNQRNGEQCGKHVYNYFFQFFNLC